MISRNFTSNLQHRLLRGRQVPLLGCVAEHSAHSLVKFCIYSSHVVTSTPVAPVVCVLMRRPLPCSHSVAPQSPEPEYPYQMLLTRGSFSKKVAKLTAPSTWGTKSTALRRPWSIRHVLHRLQVIAALNRRESEVGAKRVAAVRLIVHLGRSPHHDDRIRISATDNPEEFFILGPSKKSGSPPCLSFAVLNLRSAWTQKCPSSSA